MENFNFKFLGYFDTKKILNKILKFQESDWVEYTFRQDMFQLVHGSTKTIPILYDESYSRIMGKKSRYYDIFEDDILELNFHLTKMTNIAGDIIRFEIVKMPPFTEVGLHKDDSDSLRIDNRIHLPILTNEKVIFEVDGEKKNLKIDELWEINNGHKVHGVKNDSPYDRIHLILDRKEKLKKII